MQLVVAGTALTEEVGTLSGLEAPTFDCGHELAAAAVPALTEAGAVMTKVGTELQAGDFTGVTDFATTLQDSPLADIGSWSDAPEFQLVPTQVPACAATQ